MAIPPPNRRGALAILLASIAGGAARPASAAPPPALMLAQVYRQGVPLADYWVSEKMDGVRGYWDGRRLWTRGGEPVRAPDWFTAGWPPVPMDGELWAGRGRFTQAVSTVRQQAADDAAWRGLRFMVFDLPAQAGGFTERLTVLNGLLSSIDTPYVRPVAQARVADHAALMERMRAVVRAGGEGLMLHKGSAPYHAERTDDLLKVKPYEDADARVVAQVAGQGRHAARMGALLVELPDGRRLRIGSGFTDADRRDPPAIGSWISYRHRGTHDGGLPRFATFLRRRPDLGA